MTTVAFLSLFFGLISGPHPLELAVDGPAAAVEIQVDGHEAGQLQGPPWKGTIDFRPALLPHHIVALALDDKGREIARAEEWANLPHPLAKVDIVLERDGDRPPKAARVVWKNLAGDPVRSATLLFDGAPVTLDSEGRGVLPAHDLKSLHSLTAQVTFKSYKSVKQEIAYGGAYGTEVSTELTGVPVRSADGNPPSSPGQLAGRLTEGGKPLSVSAVEAGPAQLFVVLGAPSRDLVTKAGKFRDFTSGLAGPGDQIFLVSPFAQRIASGQELSDLFPIAPPHTGPVADLFQLLRATPLPEPAMGSLRFADAVASAGLAALRENRRRAVLLLLVENPKDASLYAPEAVRRFLAALRVPLFVWNLGPVKPGSVAAAWNAEEMVQTWRVASAVEQIRKELDSQRIVMVDGRHLPQAIELSPAAAASGLELVGAKPTKGTP